jgi:hypothetical protein
MFFTRFFLISEKILVPSTADQALVVRVPSVLDAVVDGPQGARVSDPHSTGIPDLHRRSRPGSGIISIEGDSYRRRVAEQSRAERKTKKS